MSDVQLLDMPEQLLVSDDEVFIGHPVRSWTWTNFAHLCNWLNFHARKTLPYARYLTGSPSEVQFVFPVGRPGYSTRKLTVVVGLVGTSIEASLQEVKFKSSTIAPSWITKSAALGSFSTSWEYVSSEADICYVICDLTVTAGRNELVTIQATGMRIDGFGAWELPPKMGGADCASLGNGGLESGVASIDDAVLSVCQAPPFFIGEPIDLDVGALQSAHESAWRRNRRIIASIGAGDFSVSASHGLDLHTGATEGSWVAVTTGGILVPAFASRPNDDRRIIRVAALCRLESSGTAAKWRVNTTRGYSPEDTIELDRLCWRPLDDGTYVPEKDGLPAEVGLTNEWISIELFRGVGGPKPHIHQIIIWEDLHDGHRLLDILGLWRLDERLAGSNAVDESGLGNHGVAYGDPPCVWGVIDGARDMRGGGRFQVPGSVSFWPRDELTIAGWVMFDGSSMTSSEQAVVFGIDAVLSLQMGYSGESGLVGRMVLAWQTTGGSYRIYDPAALAKGWHHVAATTHVSGGNTVRELWVDGVCVATDTRATVTLASSSHGPTLGNNYGATAKWRGFIDDLAYYATVKDATWMRLQALDHVA